MPRSEQRFFYGWIIVLVSVLGAAFSPATLINIPFGLFIREFEVEFGWQRTQISAALSIFLVVLVLLLPWAGKLIDRVGIRKVAVPSIFFYGTALASLYWLTDSLWHLYIVYALIAAVGIGAQSISFIKALSAWFDRRRGLVIGICMAGFGIGYVVIPLITYELIDHYGWRHAYLVLGIIALTVPLPATYLLLRDTPQEMSLRPDGAEPLPPQAAAVAAQVPIAGQSLAEALRTPHLWLLTVSFVLMSFALNGVQSQLVPLLTGRGYAAGSAAFMLAAVGMGSFPGRVLVGYLVDRIFAPYVAIIFYAMSAIALWVLVGGGPVEVVFLCAVVLGLSLGAENDVLGYLCGRYFGLRCFGQIYGTLLTSYLIGAALGPLVMAYAYDRFGSYDAVLHGAVGAVLIACVILTRLPRFPKIAQEA